jgi:hypothetical protein
VKYHLAIAIRFFGFANACRGLFVHGEVQLRATCEKSDRTVADIWQYLGFYIIITCFLPVTKMNHSAEGLLRDESIVVHIFSAIISALAAARPSTSSSAGAQETRPSTSLRVRARRLARTVEPEQALVRVVEPEQALVRVVEPEQALARAVEPEQALERAGSEREQALAVAPVAEQALAVEQALVLEQARAVELERELTPD